MENACFCDKNGTNLAKYDGNSDYSVISKEKAMEVLNNIRIKNYHPLTFKEKRYIFPELPYNFNFLTFAAFCGNFVVVIGMNNIGESWESKLDGMNALHLAALNDHSVILRYLLNHLNGRDPNATCDDGLSALHIACRESSFSCVEYLLENKEVDVNLKSEGGFTPLHFACFNGDILIVKLLIDKGADKNIVDSKGRKPVDLIKDRDDKESSEIKEYLHSNDAVFLHSLQPMTRGNESNNGRVTSLLHTYEHK